MDRILFQSNKEIEVLINASNIHRGGGLQVAVSFLYDIIHYKNTPFSFEIIASSEVARNLEDMGVQLNELTFFNEKNSYGIKAIWSNLLNAKSSNLIIFNIFGPHYALIEKRYQITGFAQPWILNDSAYNTLGFLQSVKSKMKYLIQELFFARADELVVELPHVKKRLLEKNIQSASKIHVVNNCVSNIYSQPHKWMALADRIENSGLKIGYVGRDYTHKNLNILPKVKEILENFYHLDITIYVTLNDEEWGRRSEYFRNNIENVGNLNIAQCPEFYKILDGVIFPSLLECFSATPVEALFMKKPLFASNRHFVIDVCDKYAIYFDPLNAHDMAEKINDYFRLPKQQQQRFVQLGYERIISMPTSEDRSENYIRLINNALNELH
jgi:glycosyltransferase involved in cell wall biosynthesis